MEIKPKYVTFEQAKLLKEKGFDLSTTKFYYLNDKRGWHKDGELGEGFNDEYWGDNTNLNWNRDGRLPFKPFSECVSAPEQWQVVEWLRVEHKIDLQAICHYNSKLERTYRMGIIFINKHNEVDTFFIRPEDDKNLLYFIEFNSPQEAYSSAFDYVLTKLI